MSTELGRLTTGEKLLLDRRRRGERQAEAAGRMKVTRVVYGRWERDRDPGAPKVLLGRLQPHERCLIYRRRAGLTQARVADDLGCCRWLINQMESGEAPCDTLAWYWEQ